MSQDFALMSKRFLASPPDWAVLLMWHNDTYPALTLATFHLWWRSLPWALGLSTLLRVSDAGLGNY